MNLEMIKSLDSQYTAQTYGRFNAMFCEGKGAKLYDDTGKEYIDFSSGIGVMSLGYSHPLWVYTVAEQAKKLAHVSNLFYTKPYALLAERLCTLSGLSAVFFANSGAEANEGLIKTARKYSFDHYGKGRSKILTLTDSFHGRTVTTLSATGQYSMHQYFDPFTEGFGHVPANNLSALKNALTPDVCGILLEGVQGEGGVMPLTEEYVKGAAALAREMDVLLLFDEVQTGMGRTGSMFSYQQFGVKPDVVSTAKGLGGGLPIGAVLFGEKCRDTLAGGLHGSTFGGNPICCAAAGVVLDILTGPGFLRDVKKKGWQIQHEISSWKLPAVKEVRGMGLMLGIVLDDWVQPKAVVSSLLEKGLVTLTAEKNVLRLLPPLTITDEEIAKGLAILKSGLSELEIVK